MTCACWLRVAWNVVPAIVSTPLFPTVVVETKGGVGAVGVTVIVTEEVELKVVVEPLVLTVDVLSVPRLHAALEAEKVQLPAEDVAPVICVFTPGFAGTVKIAPTTGSLML